MAPKEPLDPLWHSFNRSLRIEGKANRTIELYGQSVRYLTHWLTAQGP